MFAQLLEKFTSAGPVILSLTSILIITIYYFTKPQHNYPPGPTGLPFFGSLFQIIAAVRANTSPYLVDSWFQKYGPITLVKAGVIKIIYLMSGEDIKELFSREEITYRPDITLFKLLFKDQEETGLLFNNNLDSHDEMRRFTLLSLRDFGVGKSSLDEMIQVEAEAFTQYLESIATEQRAFAEDIKPKVQMCVANVIHHICFGRRYEYNDPNYHSLLRKLNEFFKVNAMGLPENFLPFIRYIPFINSRRKFKKFFESQDVIVEYVGQQIEEHRKTFDPKEIRDFVDLYLKDEQDGLSEEIKKHSDQRRFYFAIMDLFRAGTETTANTMSWSILYLIKNPQIQTQLHEEIDREIGDQTFKRSEKDKLKKVRAFINEVFRHGSIAYQGVAHSTRQDIQYKGYTIPKNATIMPAIRSIHHDKMYWKNPEVFDIDRWFGADGKLLTHKSHFMPFSVGKRACLGKQLAQIELIMFLVAILQKCSFEAIQPLSEIDETPQFGIVSQPKLFKFKVVRRM